MTIVELKHVQKFIKGELLFKLEQLAVKKQARIGLVGKNGSGKSTLLNLIIGKQEADQGQLNRYGSIKLLPQLKETDTSESGGEVTQRYINHALAEKSDLLLADEPTTNLDQSHIKRLLNQLKRWQGALILVSHDRYFLDQLCEQIWEIDQRRINVYQGNYSDYHEQKQAQIKQQEEAYHQYIEKKKQLERALVKKEQKAQRATKKPKQLSSSEARITGAKPYFAKKQKKLHQNKKALETRIEKLESVEKVYQEAPIKMEHPQAEHLSGRTILRVENLPGHIDGRTLWKPTSFQIKGNDKLAIIGNNGTGKSTLVKKIINRVNGVQLSPAIKVGYFDQKLQDLKLNQSILSYVSDHAIQSETLIRTCLARLNFSEDDVTKPIRTLSGGERVKVVLAKLLVSDANMLILDEPTNFLDIEAIEALESLLLSYPSTILFVSHDQRLIEQVATKLIVIRDQTIELFPGTYQEYLNPPKDESSHEQKLLVLETRISEVLSKLSIEPTDALEQQFQALLKEKNRMNH
ncbi:MAG TPA: ABC-F type ribosomal protection protein [Bacilli bacterium]|nr:ABC-F type ribosomal protection protein [Bacilli bacterium]